MHPLLCSLHLFRLIFDLNLVGGLPGAQKVKNLPAMQETQVWSMGWEDSLEKGKATPSSILAWRISRTEESGGQQSMGSQRVRHDWMTNIFTLNLAGAYFAKPEVTTSCFCRSNYSFFSVLIWSSLWIYHSMAGLELRSFQNDTRCRF